MSFLPRWPQVHHQLLELVIVLKDGRLAASIPHLPFSFSADWNKCGWPSVWFDSLDNHPLHLVSLHFLLSFLLFVTTFPLNMYLHAKSTVTHSMCRWVGCQQVARNVDLYEPRELIAVLLLGQCLKWFINLSFKLPTVPSMHSFSRVHFSCITLTARFAWSPSQNSQINHRHNVQMSLCRGHLCIYVREVGPHVYKDPQQTVDSHSPPCVAWPRGQNCCSHLSHKQKHNIILKCDQRPEKTLLHMS